MQIKIGEHTAFIRSSSDRFMNWIKTYFPTIDGGDLLTNATTDLSIHLVDGYGIPFVDYQVEVTSHPDQVTYQRADYLIEVDNDFVAAKIYAYDEFALKHALTNLYSAFIVHHDWGLLIHSACVEQYGRAYLFAGQSGAGKSTVAGLSTPRPILSDEASLVKISDTEISVFDSPFRSELVPSSVRKACQLTSIHLLIQATVNKSLLIKKPDALLDLINKVFFWPHDSSETVKILKMCKQLAERVPIYQLHFQKNNTFWELIS